MGGTVRKVFGGSAQAAAPVVEAPQPAAQTSAPESTAMREAEEDKSARRRARRGGRALLSEARLSAEQGVQTLGGGGQL